MKLVEKVARAMFVPMPGETWETADSFARECYLKSSRAAIAVVLEDILTWGYGQWGNPRSEIWADSINDYARGRALNPKEKP